MQTRILCVSMLFIAGSVAVAADPKTPRPEVVVVQPVIGEVTDYERFYGYAEPASKVKVRALVSGVIDKVLFKDGTDVKKGDVLFEIDPRPIQAELEKAEAHLTLAEVQLKDADAEYHQAKSIFEMNGANRASLKKAKRQRDKAEAQVRIARANRDQAKFALDSTKVDAPVSGRLSARLVEAGEVVTANATHLVTIAVHDPMYITFDLNDDQFLKLKKAVKSCRTRSEGEWGLHVTVAVGYNDRRNQRKGTLTLVESQGEGEKRHFQARVIVSNADRQFSPGQLVRDIRVETSDPRKALFVPSSLIRIENPGAIQTRLYTLVVNSMDKVERREPKFKLWEYELGVVDEGLKPDDRVIVGDVSGVREGMTVTPRKEEEKLKGRWKQVSHEEDGQVTPQKSLCFYEFHKNNFTVRVEDIVLRKGTFAVTPWSNPRCLDLTYTALEDDREMKQDYFYEWLDKDTLKLAVPVDGNTEPLTIFSTKEGKCKTLVLKRVTSESP